MKTFILLLCWVSFAFSTKGDNSWDFLFFVQRWAGTAGYGQNLPADLDIFTVHGLWPSRFDGSYPSYCNSSQPFNPSLISSLVSTLDTVWYNYQSGSSDSFWSHEWEKHGTCAESLPIYSSEYKFFYGVIQLHNKYHLISALKSKSIVPTSEKNYRTEDISDAIESVFGVKPALTCQSTSLGSSLMRLGLCLNKSLNLIDCPSSAQESSCGTYAYIPPINGN